ncbi:hypothetical protein CsatB_003689 [Cannabis sativa]
MKSFCMDHCLLIAFIFVVLHLPSSLLFFELLLDEEFRIINVFSLPYCRCKIIFVDFTYDKKGKEPDVSEFISALAEGNNAQLMVMACAGALGANAQALVAARHQTGIILSINIKVAIY